MLGTKLADLGSSEATLTGAHVFLEGVVGLGKMRLKTE